MAMGSPSVGMTGSDGSLYTDTSVSNIRAVIAKRLLQSKQVFNFN